MLGLAITVMLSATVAPANDPSVKKLSDALARFEHFENERAEMLLREFLAEQPQSALAAKAHLYLGLIALNADKLDAVRSEFKAALQFNPAIELPPDASPKAKLSFLRARAEWGQELEQLNPNTPPPATFAPAQVPVAEPGVRTKSGAASPAVPGWHAASWVLMGLGVAAEVTAIVGGVQVMSYNATMASGTPGQHPMSNLIQSQNNANFWSKAWLPFAIGGAVVGGSAIFAW